MGKILLIEPQKVMRQAISLYLFPEHDVVVEEHLKSANVESLKDYDLMIIDGAALREVGRLPSESIRAIQGCKTPVVWLEQDEASHSPKRDKLIILNKPIEREKFQSALNALLSSAAPSRTRKGSIADSVPKEGSVKKRAEELPQAELPFIDLVDVVEEQPPSKQRKKTSRKSK